MDSKTHYLVTSSPHTVGSRTVRNLMLDVIIALMFPAIASVVLFGYEAAVRIAVSIVGCVVFEWLYCKLLKRPVSIGDLSAVVTGILLAFNVPAEFPVWMLIIGDFVSIIIVKMLFGGVGCNFVNPALAGRVVLMLSFGAAMTTFSFPAGVPDTIASVTPLALLADGNQAMLDVPALLLGTHGGVLGETCALALLLGFVYLLIRGVIRPVITATYVGTVFLMSLVLGHSDPLLSVLSGGLLLGAVFMATDYTTSPFTNWGHAVFGVGCGILTTLIRLYSASTEGVTYAILIMNLLVPYINDLTRRRPFGRGGARNNG